MSGTGAKRILLVDDCREINDANSDYLTDKGYAVRAAESGAEALAKLEEGRFDCTVLDVQLPDTDGYTLCRRIKESYGAPVLFLTCRDSGEDYKKGKLAGCDGYMTKPYTLKELAWQISTLIRRQEKAGSPEAGIRTPAGDDEKAEARKEVG